MKAHCIVLDEWFNLGLFAKCGYRLRALVPTFATGTLTKYVGVEDGPAVWNPRSRRFVCEATPYSYTNAHSDNAGVVFSVSISMKYSV